MTFIFQLHQDQSLINFQPMPSFSVFPSVADSSQAIKSLIERNETKKEKNRKRQAEYRKKTAEKNAKLPSPERSLALNTAREVKKNAKKAQRVKKAEEIAQLPSPERIQAVQQQKSSDSTRMKTRRAKKAEEIAQLPSPERVIALETVKTVEKQKKRNQMRRLSPMSRWAKNYKQNHMPLQEFDEFRENVINSFPFSHEEDIEEIIELIQNENVPENFQFLLDDVTLQEKIDLSNVDDNYSLRPDADIDDQICIIDELPLEVLIDEELEDTEMNRILQILTSSNEAPDERISILYALDFEENSIRRDDIGAMDSICRYCDALHFSEESNSKKTFTTCCYNGKIKLPIEQPYPSFLEELLTDDAHPNHANFIKHIRSYNNAFAMCSLGASRIDLLTRFGPPVVKIQGQVYHKTSHAVAATGQTPQFAQLYVLDCDEANALRSSHPSNVHCLGSVINEISSFLDQQNVITKTYKMMKDVIREAETEARNNNQEIPTIRMDFVRDRNVLQPNQHPGRFNAPTASNEIAMIFVNPDGEPPFERDIKVYRKNPDNSQHQMIPMNILNPLLEPMTYPLLMPYGNDGWKPSLHLDSYIQHSRAVTMLQYYSAKMQIRRGQFNPYMNAGKLTQQWLIDSYLKVEANNLNYHKTHQSDMRVENYRHLHDAQSANNNDNIGRPIILSSTFEGSPRNMNERCRDAMAMFAKLGPPDLFITFTCNANWPEIKDNLKQGQQACDRPDLVSRVFNLKLDHFMKDVIKHNFFGEVICYAYTIEFQKRGLPHAHMLFTLREQDKFKTAEMIDKYVSAQIPDKETHPELYDIVTKCMIHGPCGNLNPNSVCMENGKCTKHFPKAFNKKTKPNVAGYPLYERPEFIKNGQSYVTVNRKKVDNRFVVPYNPKLLLK